MSGFVRAVGAYDEGESGEVMDAAAVREVDLQKKYHRSPYDLADKLGVSRPRATALREHPGS